MSKSEGFSECIKKTNCETPRGEWGQRRANPPSLVAIDALLFAFCSWRDLGRSSRSRSEVWGVVLAPDPSMGHRRVLHHCPGLSPSAWERRRWVQGLASYETLDRRKKKTEAEWRQNTDELLHIISLYVQIFNESHQLWAPGAPERPSPLLPESCIDFCSFALCSFVLKRRK